MIDYGRMIRRITLEEEKEKGEAYVCVCVWMCFFRREEKKGIQVDIFNAI